LFTGAAPLTAARRRLAFARWRLEVGFSFGENSFVVLALSKALSAFSTIVSRRQSAVENGKRVRIKS